jgi:ATP-dependent Zn protease
MVYEDEMKVMLAGRVTEEVVLGDSSTGASNDLERVTDMAYYLVGKVGLSGSDKLGLMALLGRRDRTGSHESALSEVTNSALDAEARRMVNQQYKLTTALVRSKVDLVRKLAAELERHDVLLEPGEEEECK